MAVWKPGITAQIKENKNSAVEIPGLALHEDRNYGTRQEKAIWCRNIAGQEPSGSLRITAPDRRRQFGAVILLVRSLLEASELRHQSVKRQYVP